MKRLTWILLSLLTLPTLGLEKAVFAGGCFWCMEPPFEKLIGVKAVVSGFAGGKEKNPSYKDVASGKTTHVEAVEVTYDPKLVTYARLLEVFFSNIDPTDNGGQFVDRGAHYRPAVFYRNSLEKKATEQAIRSLEKLKIFKKPIKTEVTTYTNFYAAQDYHQDFYKKNLKSKLRYKLYRSGSGRDDFIKKHYPSGGLKLNAKNPKYVRATKEELKKKLTPIQYQVTQEDATEKPFSNEFNEHKEEGIYVDIVSGEPLFASGHKYNSGSGWPSFYQPLNPDNIVEVKDSSLGIERIEIRSRNADSHLGHAFPDGPQPTGIRYCINSAALKFIPKADLKKHGLEEYESLF